MSDSGSEHNPRLNGARSVAISKNFANYPLARDIRRSAGLRWARSKPHGHYWLATLPGEDRIRIKVPTECPDHLRRAPSPFDVNVLFEILREAQVTRRRVVEYPSRSALLQAMDFGADADNLRNLAAALLYWSCVHIRFIGNWYRKGGHEDITLPPPLTMIEPGARRLRLRIDDEWLPSAAAGYFVEVPLPLPRDAAAQNLVLLVLTSARNNEVQVEGGKAHYPREATTLCRKVGLKHSTRNRVLRRALDTAMEYFAGAGGQFVYAWDEGERQVKLAVLGAVKVDRSWRTKPKEAVVAAPIAASVTKLPSEPKQPTNKAKLLPTRVVYAVKTTDEDGNPNGTGWELPDGRIVDEVPGGYERINSAMPDHVRERFAEQLQKQREEGTLRKTREKVGAE